MDTKTVGENEQNTNQDLSTTSNVSSNYPTDTVETQQGQQVNNQAVSQQMPIAKKSSNKLIFWCFIFPWILIIGSMILSAILNFVIILLGNSGIATLFVSLITFLISLSGFILIPVGVVYYIVKVSNSKRSIN